MYPSTQHVFENLLQRTHGQSQNEVGLRVGDGDGWDLGEWGEMKTTVLGTTI